MAFRLFRGAASAAPEEKASAVGPMMAIHGNGRAVWSARDTASLARTGYEQNVVGFRCVRMVAEAAAAVPFLVSERGERMLEHPLLRLLTGPNPAQDGRSLMEAVYGFLQLAGNAYLEAACHGHDGLPMELHVLRPDRMRVIPGADGWPVGYEYAVGAKKHRFDQTGEVKPILHLKAFHPLDDHYGMAPMEAAAASIDLHNAAARWCKALLDNAARPSGAIVFSGGEGKGHLSEEQFQRLSREIEDNHQGARNAGRPMLLEGGLDWKPMGYSPSDMEFLETKNAAAREIALAFGVPPMLLGIPGDNTYANYQEANRAFYRQTVLPLVRKTGQAMASWFGPEIGLEPDVDAVPALAGEREALWRRIASADFLAEDEKRQLLGLPPR